MSSVRKARLLEGSVLAKKIQQPLAHEVQKLRKRFSHSPVLGVIRVGSKNQAQASYLRSQKRLAEKLGIGYQLINLKSSTNERSLIRTIQRLNKSTSVSAILILMPLPKRIDVKNVVHHILPSKDAEGLHSENLGRLVMERDHVVPPTAGAILRLLKSTHLNLRGKEVVVVGHSKIVGRPLSLLLLRELATTTVCHIATSHRGRLGAHVRRAEVLVVAVGKAGLVKGSWVKKGAIVIDVGMSMKGKKIVGDVEFKAARRRARFITPVPGGVGPLTVTILMQNVVECFKWQNGVGRHRM
jgi:methylenetetrahydrofolate dehydrogenase (NADP+) / methenyltetrahydrofolate cyclohydrolase